MGVDTKTVTLPEPAVCGRCDDGVVELRAGRGRTVKAVCPDCRCPGCGAKHVGLCDDCEGDDFVQVDTAQRRAADELETVPRSDELQPALWGAE